MSPVSKCGSHIVQFAYVDDTDIISLNNIDIHLTTDKVMEDMQLAIDLWEGGIKATGGAIVPSKSWIFPIDFKFDAQGKWSYRTSEEIGFEFTIRDADNVEAELQSLDPTIGKETLGVVLAPDGNNTQAVEDFFVRQRSGVIWYMQGT